MRIVLPDWLRRCGQSEEWFNSKQVFCVQLIRQGVTQVREAGMPYLLMVSCCLACCCLGMQMMLGERRFGLPSPELVMLLLRPLRDMLRPACEWFIMFLVFIGKIPLLRNRKCLTWHNLITVHRAGLLFSFYLSTYNKDWYECVWCADYTRYNRSRTPIAVSPTRRGWSMKGQCLDTGGRRGMTR